MRLKRYDAFGLPEDVMTVLRTIRRHTYFERDPVSPNFYVVVGGDGAILAEKRRREIYAKPVFLVHCRRHSLKSLGFTADVELGNLDKALDDIEVGRYTLQMEQLLECRMNQQEVGVALNEVTVKPSDPAYALLFRTLVKNKKHEMELLSPKCDGIIVSTKFGSPAWNLSYGGPISLDLPLMSITFLGSHIKHEHYVCSLDDRVSVSVLRDAVVILDSEKHAAASGSTISIEKSDKCVKFIRTDSTIENLSSKAMRQIEFSLKSMGEPDAH